MDWMSNLWRAVNEEIDAIPIPTAIDPDCRKQEKRRSYLPGPALPPGWIAGNAAVETTSILECGILVVRFYPELPRPGLKRKEGLPSIGRVPATKLWQPALPTMRTIWSFLA